MFIIRQRRGPRHFRDALKLSNLRDNRNLWLVTCFTIYAVFFFIFAGIYLAIFRSNPRNFSFNSEVSKAQASEFVAPVERRLSGLKAKLDLYYNLVTKVREQDEMFLDTISKLNVLKSESALQIYWDRSTDDQLQVSLTYVEGHTTSSTGFAIPFPHDRNAFIDKVFSGDMERLQNEVKQEQDLLNELEGPTAQIWSYWDFFYFSVITQTTVGYGDILPNSTLVRMVVTGQLIIGLMILTILISLSFKKKKVRKP